ncbi:MAG: hypothetical protein ABJB21_10530, partial [bacterium]
MRNHHAMTLRNVVFSTVAAILATTSLATQVFAQGRLPNRTESPAERLRRERAERQTRELELRSVESLGRTKPVVEDRSERVIYQQISEDFQRLQVANNEMMQATFPSKSTYTPDSKHISKSTEEINKRASRLLTNLRLPETEDKEQKSANADILHVYQLKSALLTLDSLVMSFIANPTFEHPNTVVDIAQSIRAKRDLQGIIELSRRIKQGSE